MTALTRNGWVPVSPHRALRIDGNSRQIGAAFCFGVSSFASRGDLEMFAETGNEAIFS